MDNVLDILTRYKERGIRIGLDDTGENLSIKGELSSLSDLDKVELRSSKELLLSFLLGQKQQSLVRTVLPLGQRVPLSPSQKGIWFHSRIEENDTMYLIPSVYDLFVQGLKQEDLLSAAEVFVGEHPLLACVFGEEEGEPYQELKAFDLTNHLFFEDLSQLSNDDREAQFAEQIRLSMQQGFDLSQQAPWSITVFDLGEDQYRFFVKIHHLIADGATLGLLVEGLVEAYGLQEKGQTYHYSGAHHHDYVSWITDKSHQQRSSNFWKTYLEHYPDDLELPTTVLGQQTDSATSVEQTLVAVLREKTTQFSASHNIPLSQLFTFSFGVVLSKHCRQADVIIGTPVEGRIHPDLQKMPGDLVNTVPVRLVLNYETSVLDNLQAFGKGYLSVLEHQQYPFAFILDDIGYQRQADRFPLFNTMVSFPNNQELGAKRENELKLAKEQALYDLTLSVIELTDSTELQLEFDTKKFTKTYATRLLEQTLTILEQVVNSAQTALSEISLLTDRERKEYLEKGLPKAETKPTLVSVVEAIKVIISKSPESIAVVEVETTYSYAALQLKSQAVAWSLAEKGIQSGDRVVVELPSGMDLLAAMLGIWQKGGVYVPVGTESPTTRKEEILEDSGAVIVIDALFIEALSQTTDQGVERSSVDLAYILYTSGSTGKPKGVAVSHGALINKMMEEAALVKTTTLTTLTLTSPTFDVSLLELILPLTLGGTVVVPQDKSNTFVFESILQNKVNVLQGTPTYFSHLESDLDESAAQSLNETLELLCIGGESLNDTLVKRLKRKLPDVRINNHYGPTEITIDALVKEDVSEFKVNSLGRPFGNTGVMIVDDYDNVLPESVPGELLITGPSLATGYWANGQETATKFSNIEKLGVRVYKTGDLATWSKEGEIHFIGRKDKQVKYRGYRIELEEINARLREITGIKDAYTLVISNVLVSWIATDGVDETLIREQLQQILQGYMIPTVYEQLSVLPMNANGKVDEKQLPQPRSLKAEYVAPRNELEEQLVQIWQEVLGVEKVGIYDNFFELGGHSLKLMQLLLSYSKKLNITVKIKDLYLKATIAQHIEHVGISVNGKDLIPVAPRDRNYPLTSAQLRLWVMCQFEEVSVAYNMPVRLKIQANLNIGLFKKAVHLLAERHEGLRTTFSPGDSGIPVQQVIDSASFESPILVFQSETSFDEERAFFNFIDADKRTPFDLSTGPLFRIAVLKRNELEFVVYYNIHHIISDGISNQIIQRDLSAIYYSLVNEDSPLEIPKLRLQYKDVAVWENRTEKSEIAQKYWLEKFPSDIPLFELVNSRPRPLLKTYNGKSIGIRISSESTELIKQFIGKQSGSLFSFLLASWNVLFYQYTAKNTTVIGAPYHGRDDLDLVDQVGLYIRTMAFVNALDPNESFTRYYNRVKDEVALSIEYNDFSFEELIDALHLNTPKNRSPLFDILLTLEQVDHTIQAYDEANEFGITDLGVHQLKYDMEISVTESEKELFCALAYNSDIYDDSFMQQLLLHYKSLIEVLCCNSTVVLGKISSLQANEQQQLMQFSKASNAITPAYDTVANMFEKNVLDHPEKTALCFENKTFTYEELNGYSNRLAHFLKNGFNVQSDSRIGICLERNEWLVVALLAVLKSGGAYVPVSPDFPAERINLILSDSQCITIVDRELLETFFEKLVELPDHNPEVQTKASDLAYVIYTSGSTGTPKGVMIDNHSLTSFFYQLPQIFGLSSEDVFLSNTNIVFDISNLELLGSLTNGMTIHLLRDSDPDTFLEALQSKAITAVQLTPSRLDQLLAASSVLADTFAGLNALLIGGEELKPVQRSFLEALNIKRVFNVYGPTETTIWSSMWEIEPQIPINIGKPLPTEQIYILNAFDGLCPIGVPGEICIAGSGLARGYINNPELTEQKFVPNPFDPGQRMYKTGDMGYWNADGQIVCIGRTDDQVKIRGHRIELGEIENELLSIEKIAAAAVIIHPKDPNSLMAFFTENEPVTAVELRKHLVNKLPKYMIPGSFQRLASMPLTPSGKINRVALRKFDFSTTDFPEAFVKPTTLLQKQLAQLWSDVLNRPLIGITADFFESGGHSLTAIRLINQISETIGIRLSIKEIFENPTVEAQARLLESKDNSVLNEIPQLPLQEFYPLSSSQQRLWLLCQFEEANKAYNIPGIFEINGSLNTVFLKESLQQIIGRHETLRTVFGRTPTGELGQRILNEELFFENYPDYFSIQQINELELPDLLAKVVSDPFDLKHGPLFRCLLFQLEEERYVFVYVLHHIISDAQSVEVLMNELQDCYSTLFHGRSWDPVPLRIQFKEIAHYEQQKLTEGTLNDSAAYWHQELKGELPVLDLIPDFSRPPIQSFNGDSIEETISSLVFNKFSQTLNEDGATTFMGLLAVLNVLLFRYSGQTDIIIGSPVSSRSTREHEQQVGFLVNTLPLRNSFNQTDSFLELLRNVRSNCLNAFNHKEYPFDALIREINPNRDRSRNAVFDVMMTFTQLAETEKTGSLGPLEIRAFPSEGSTNSKFDLTFNFIKLPDGLSLCVEYNTSLFTHERVESMAIHLKQLISAVTQHPEKPIGLLNYLSVNEKQQLLIDFNTTESPLPDEDNLLSSFDQMVIEVPQAIALISGEEKLTYKVLNDSINQLAHYLIQKKGLAPGDFVTIRMGRKTPLIISILAVLRAKGTYVPVDTNYPEERIAYIENDSKSTFTLDENIYTEFIRLKDQFPKNIPNVESDEKQLAYVIYTSGTTGNPKGVTITHTNAVALIEWAKTEFKNTGFETVIAATSHCFDLSIFEVFFPLSIGKTVQLIPSILEIEPVLATGRKLLINTVPSSMRAILDADYTLENVSAINLAGEVFPVDLASRLQKRPLEIRNLYGPSEDTTYSTVYRIENKNYQSIPIGRPITNTKAYVLDNDMNLVPVGVPGRLYLSGAGISAGYLGKDQLTREKFIANPFEPSTVMYDTGDKVRWLTDGNLEYFGREDTQIKLRGYRIELEEIEKHLLALDGISEAAVAINQINGQENLVGHLVTESFDIEQIRNCLNTVLPGYMVPSYFVTIDEIPLTPNGKIDRKRLNALTPFLKKQMQVPAATEMEHVVLRIWKEVLKFSDFGVTDDFFELGGNSLVLITIFEKIKEETGFQIDLVSFYNARTVREQASLAGSKTDIEDTLPILVDKMPNYVHYYWTKAKESPKAKNVSFALVTDESIDIDRLNNAFENLMDKHTILSCCVSEEKDHVKFIQSSRINGIQVISGLSREEAAQRCTELHDTKFQLENENLCKGYLFKLTDGKSLLFFSVAHLIFDGFSLTLFWKDLFKTYASGEPLEPLQYQFVESGLRREKTTLESTNRGVEYWKEFFTKDIPTVSIHKGTKQVSEVKAIETIFNLDINYHEPLELLCKSIGISFNDFFIGLIALTLESYRSQKNYAICFDHHSRSNENINQIGFWVQSIFSEVTVNENDTLDQFFLEVKKFANESISHTDVDLLMTMEATLGENFESRLLPLKHVRFNYYDESVMHFDLNAMRYEHLYFNNTHLLPIYLHFFAVRMKQGITINIMANNSYFDMDELLEIEERYKRLYVGVMTSLIKTTSIRTIMNDLKMKNNN